MRLILAHLLLALALGLGGATADARAQGGRQGDNILYPQPPLPLFVGFEAGYSTWEHEAMFSVGDGFRSCADFLNGDGEGPAAGVRSFIYLTTWLVVSPRLRYESRPGLFMTSLGSEPGRDARDSVVLLAREGQVDASFAAAVLDVRIGMDFFSSGVYLAAGPALSVMMGGEYDYLERITEPEGFRFAETGTNEALLAPNRRYELYEQLAFDVRGGLGYILELGRIGINPEIMFTIPLTSVLKSPEKMKQTSLSGSIGVLYNFGEVR